MVARLEIKEEVAVEEFWGIVVGSRVAGRVVWVEGGLGVWCDVLIVGECFGSGVCRKAAERLTTSTANNGVIQFMLLLGCGRL